MDFRWSIIEGYAPLFIKGFFMTLEVAVISIIAGTVMGLLLGMLRLADVQHGAWKYILRVTKWIASFYVAFFRGTPLFVQILLIHFAVMPVLIHQDNGLLISGELARTIKQDYGAFVSGIVALSLNAAAYISEIFRAGIQSIERGQSHAASSLGMGYRLRMRYIILPQAFRRMLPPLGNEAITLLKDSSLVSTIGLAELAYAARTVAGSYSRYWEPYITISVVYFSMTICLAMLVARLEKKYSAPSRH
ncbi:MULTISPECIES: amino acid ABC transporter permease [unclassified Herbaspirillum]|uniref:amino acid ABC transporter permease n=1 Tax=unclassified Herbaspirillum TaxID=2624150 RepID=UPI000E2EAF2C|nr:MULTISPECIES: amino acid ABC transporter permease [unclassified Herbaspirillum]RFB71317.1 amino acid ABC transporter permease [Herbaspirillum sp. 3R-3a1]TFI09119.1 amino acid ABC transporter permease [Herbaspirillum sp. 3R11]TFI15537.1 amino acid ABC transporter permease [Herbaspirillum sp. 3R-11]TFI29426.1 amino acid ABC transporter permease [Herbaspirillum sp. 3C11]